MHKLVDTHPATYLLLNLTRCTAIQCIFDVYDHRYWSKEPLLALHYLHPYSPCSWHLHCQLVASYQSPVQHTILSGHTSCLWVRPSTSLSLTCGSKSSRLHLSILKTSRHLVLLPTDVVAGTYLVSVSMDLHAGSSRQCPPHMLSGPSMGHPAAVDQTEFCDVLPDRLQ